MCVSGHKDALTVKFADGGNKKRNQFQGRQSWMDRPQDQVSESLHLHVNLDQ